MASIFRLIAWLAPALLSRPCLAAGLDSAALDRALNPFAALEVKVKQCASQGSPDEHSLEAQRQSRETQLAFQRLEADPKSKPITPVARAILQSACRRDKTPDDCAQAAACYHDALRLYLQVLDGPHGLPLKLMSLPQQALPGGDPKSDGKDFAADINRAADGCGDPVDYSTTAGAVLADLNPNRWLNDQAEAKFNPDEEATQRTEAMLGHDLAYKKKLTQAELFCLALDGNRGKAVKAAGTVAEILHNHRAEYPARIWGLRDDGKDYYRYVGLYFELQPGLINRVEEAAGMVSATVSNGAVYGTAAGFKTMVKDLQANSGGIGGPVAAAPAAAAHGISVGWTQAGAHTMFARKMREFYTGVCAADAVRGTSIVTANCP